MEEYMRLMLSFLIASAWLATALYVLFAQAFTAKFVTPDGCAFGIVLTYVGSAWLWVDFIGPMMRGEKIV